MHPVSIYVDTLVLAPCCGAFRVSLTQLCVAVFGIGNCKSLCLVRIMNVAIILTFLKVICCCVFNFNTWWMLSIFLPGTDTMMGHVIYCFHWGHLLFKRVI